LNNDSLCVLFPGQGSYYKGVLADYGRTNPQVKEIFSVIDAVALQHLKLTVSDQIWGTSPASIEQLLSEAPDVLQLAMYGVSVVTYKLLEAQGLQPSQLVGHSFGEIAALVCAGAFNIQAGAEIVCHRVLALRTLENSGGYMAALSADAYHANKIVELLNNQKVVVAVENHAGQTVISGTKEVMDAVGELCRILQISFVKLNSPYPFHSPLMQPAVAEFASRMRHLRARPLQVPVYSPILERYYQSEDVLTACLAEHLVKPVKFMSAIQRLHSDGTQFFVECGALDNLCKIVTRVLKEAEPVTVATLNPRLGDEKSMMNAVNSLQTYNLIGEKVTGEKMPAIQDDSANELIDSIGEMVFPGIAKATFAAFWAERGPTVMAYALEEFDQFLSTYKVSFSAVMAQAMGAEVPANLPVAMPAMPPSASPAPVSPAMPVKTRANRISREALFKELTSLYATALEYPEEVFTEDVELEAELGIDSVKQTELLARISEKYNLPPRPTDFRMSDYHTMGLITDFVYEMQGAGAAATNGASAPVAATPVLAPVQAVTSPANDAAINHKLDRDALFKELTSLYAAALEYPEEVFTEDVELEAELGIDSVKQTELLARISEKYNLPPRPTDFRMSDYHTMGLITDFVYQMQGAGQSAAREMALA
jgi:malonyl CoA-acyl carrier protein transacylase